MYSDVLCSKYIPARLKRDLHTREEMLEFKVYKLDIEKTVNAMYIVFTKIISLLKEKFYF